MAVLLLAAGLAEVLDRAKLLQTRLRRFVAPAAFVSIGFLFFIHTEYGTPEAVAESVFKHRIFGLVITLAGSLKQLTCCGEEDSAGSLFLDCNAIGRSNVAHYLSRACGSV